MDFAFDCGSHIHGLDFAYVETIRTMKSHTAGVAKLRRMGSGLYVPRFSGTANNLTIPGTAPGDADLIGGYPTEADLGFRTSTLKDVRAALSEVGFEQGLIAASLLNANVYLFRHDREQQLHLAKRIYEPELFEAIARSIVRFPESFPFSEQNCFILQRLLIDEAVEVTTRHKPSPDDLRTVVHAAISCASISGQAGEESVPKVGQPLADWLAFNIQSGAYSSDRLLAVEITRAQELFARLAELPNLKDSRFPISMWSLEDYGFSVAEQMTLGLSAWFQTNTTGPDGPFSVHVKPDEFNELLVRLGWLDRRQQALDLISAPREQMQQEFAEAGHDIANVVWETRPFMRHPFLRCQDDGLILLSPRAMHSWLGDGFHYRLLVVLR